MFCRSLFVLFSFFIVEIVLSVVLHFKAFDCPFGIFKMFLYIISLKIALVEWWNNAVCNILLCLQRLNLLWNANKKYVFFISFLLEYCFMTAWIYCTFLDIKPHNWFKCSLYNYQWALFYYYNNECYTFRGLYMDLYIWSSYICHH